MTSLSGRRTMNEQAFKILPPIVDLQRHSLRWSLPKFVWSQPDTRRRGWPPAPALLDCSHYPCWTSWSWGSWTSSPAFSLLEIHANWRSNICQSLFTLSVHNSFSACTRPFASAVHCAQPNELWQFDDMELGPSSNHASYVIIIGHDGSIYCPLCILNVLALKSYFRLPLIGAPRLIYTWLISDCSTNFENMTVHFITKALHLPHHFTFLYFPGKKCGSRGIGA